MRALAYGCVLVLTAVVPGCGDSTGDDGANASSTTTPATSGASSTGPSAATDSTGSPPTPTTTAEGTSGPGPSTSTGPSNDSTGPGSTTDPGDSGGICEPPPPEGDICLECVHANCCTAWQACMNDEPCACVVDCHVVQGNSLGNCSNTCNLDSDLYQALYFCGQGSCLGNCDWDCC